MNNFYPINIRLSGKKIVLIGGGKIAERKIRSFRDCDAILEVISPTLTEGMYEMFTEAVFVWKQKYFSKEDIDGAFMVIAATNDPLINQAVKGHASANQLVCLLDQQDQSDVQFPAVVRRGKLTIATSTSGASPVLAKTISKKLANEFDERYVDFLEFLAEARNLILENVADSNIKKELLTTIVNEAFLQSNQRWDDFKQILIERKIALPNKE